MQKTFRLETKYGIIRRVPIIDWKEFHPYWEDVVLSIVEVVMENNFRPHPASMARPDGVVATARYWDHYKEGYGLEVVAEAIRFLNLLKSKKKFSTAIREFNKDGGVDWLSNSNIHLLGNRICGFYYTLQPIFYNVKAEDREWLKVKFV